MAAPKPKIVVVAGPTGAGKTAVGIDLAQRVRGEIVSADSIQVYRHMDIGSAKPTRAERAYTPHHMIDIRDPDEDFTGGDYAREARQCIARILDKDRVPIVVGGTGLYIRLLVRGIVDLPGPDPELRKRLRAEEAAHPGALFEQLMCADPDGARSMGRANLPRIIRALEVFRKTGTPLSQWQAQHAFDDRPYDCLFLCLAPDRKVLYEQVDTRVDNMIKNGLLEEVCNLLMRGYSPDLKAMQSIGYRHMLMVRAGEVDLGRAAEFMKRDTRHYAKRQFTWFRSEPEAIWCDPGEIVGIRLMVTNFLGR
jgi:tRNA dimethylallyltransferase